jgi:hypothetical protein
VPTFQLQRIIIISNNRPPFRDRAQDLQIPSTLLTSANILIPTIQQRPHIINLPLLQHLLFPCSPPLVHRHYSAVISALTPQCAGQPESHTNQTTPPNFLSCHRPLKRNLPRICQHIGRLVSHVYASRPAPRAQAGCHES